MAKEHEIVAYINTVLKATQFSASRFQKGRFSAIAELVKTEEGELKPGTCNNYGEVTYVGIDDTYPFQIYHRVIQPNLAENVEYEFGDRKALRETTNMLMVVIGDRARLQLTAEDIKTGIAASLPLELPTTELNTLGLQQVNILPGSFNWNRFDVYRAEFNIQDSFFNTNTIIFSLSYQIETTYDQACFTLCE